MDSTQINSFLDSLESPAFSEKHASLFFNPVTTRLMEGAGAGISGAGKYLAGFGKRLFRPTIERFQQGAGAGRAKYVDDLVKRIAKRGGGGNTTLNPLTETTRELASTLKGGVGEALGGSAPGRALNALSNRNSNLWRGGVGTALGRDPLTAAFNVYAGLEGARKGKEVGGTTGAIAGGLGALGASRAAWAMGDLFKRGLMRDMQNQMLGGRMTALRARPGALRGAVGDWLERGGRAAEGLMGGQGGKLVGPQGALQGTINRLQKARGAGMRNAINVAGPNGPVALPMAKGQGGGMPGLSSLVTVPLGVGAMAAATSAGEAGGQMAFDGYKHLSSAMHQRQQRDMGRENFLRKRSPEFQATGYNPYANQGG